MDNLERIARAAVEGDGLLVRSLVQEWLETNPQFDQTASPATCDAEVLAVAASIAELLSERMGQRPPGWTRIVGPLEQPRFLLKSAATMKRLRRMCEEEAPPSLKRRNLFAPADYLRFA